MWENAAKHTDTPPAPPAAAEPGEYDTLLWAQIILCVLIAAGVFAARALELPLYSTLRTDYRYALAQPGPDFWNTDGSRNVVRFTQETFAELRGVLRQVAAQTPETAARTGTATASRWPAPKRICRGLCSNILCRANLLLKPPLTEPALIPCRAKRRSSIPVRIFPLCRVHRFMLPQAGWCA